MIHASFIRRAGISLALLVAASAACAHPGHDSATVIGFAGGLLHPFSGFDHLLAMVAVGLWSAAALRAGRRWTAPVLFVGVMTLAALTARLGLATLPMAGIEMLVAASVIVLGAMLLAAPRIRPAIGLALLVPAAWMHGTVHGLEAMVGAPLLSYVVGMVLATALLHGLGLASGTALVRWRLGLSRLLGAAIGLSGLALLITRL